MHQQEHSWKTHCSIRRSYVSLLEHFISVKQTVVLSPGQSCPSILPNWERTISWPGQLVKFHMWRRGLTQGTSHSCYYPPISHIENCPWIAFCKEAYMFGRGQELMGWNPWELSKRIQGVRATLPTVMPNWEKDESGAASELSGGHSLNKLFPQTSMGI